MFKKVYLEITNKCNLKCDFCNGSKDKNRFLALEEYKLILNKLERFTKYLYLHVSGEPLMHPLINEFINIGSNKFNINITTNGYLIKRIKNNHNIRQINISLHSYDTKYKVSLKDYMNNIFEVIDELSKDTYISLRFWVDNKYNKEMIKYINDRYNTSVNLKENSKIKDNVFINIGSYFIWPSLDNEINSEFGTCYALKDHIGILSDGEVVPCCLDTFGVINLGNIFESNLDVIINSKRYNNMLNGFNNNKKCEELCKKCNFLESKIE